jgi:hypothetical protein
MLGELTPSCDNQKHRRIRISRNDLMGRSLKQIHEEEMKQCLERQQIDFQQPVDQGKLEIIKLLAKQEQERTNLAGYHPKRRCISRAQMKRVIEYGSMKIPLK